MNLRTFPSFVFAALLVSTAAHAKDLGVQGTLFPIEEVDIRQLMVESALRADWSSVQDEAKKSAETYLSRLPKRQLPEVERTVTKWMDPSIVVSSDIQAPLKQADGSYQWQVMVKAGTKVNPLKQFRPLTAMLFFDGSDETQRKFVKDTLALEPNRIVPVEAGSGDFKNTVDYMGRAVFHANDSLMSRFQVTHLPTLVYPGEGDRSLQLGITSFARPFNPKEVISNWQKNLAQQTSPRRPAGPATRGAK